MFELRRAHNAKTAHFHLTGDGWRRAKNNICAALFEVAIIVRHQHRAAVHEPQRKIRLARADGPRIRTPVRPMLTQVP